MAAQTTDNPGMLLIISGPSGVMTASVSSACTGMGSRCSGNRAKTRVNARA